MFTGGGVALKALSVAALACLFSISANNSANASMYVPTLGVNSAYSLEKADAPANNTIEIPTYNSDTKLVESINYELGIKDTVLGTENGDTSRTYSVNILPDYDIDFTVKYNASDIKSKVSTGTQLKDYSGVWVDLNSPTTKGNYIIGSAINNYSGKIGNISGLFINNTITTDLSAKWHWGAAVLLKGVNGDIDANFINNGINTTGEASGGAVAMAVTAPNRIIGDFISNYASGDAVGWGGALYIANCPSGIGLVKGNWIANYTSSTTSALGGAIEVNWNAKIGGIESDFIGNYSKGGIEAYGGAIHNGGRIDSIKGDFISNYAAAIEDIAFGGAIANYPDNRTTAETGIGSITGNFYNNYVLSEGYLALGGALYNSVSIDNLISDFYGNYAKSLNDNAYGGAIYNEGTITNYIKGDFVGNYAISETGVAQGGAIYTDNDLNFVADNDDMIIAGNYTVSNGVKDDNAIYVDSADATLNFDLKNSANFILKDNIDGLAGYNVNVIGDGSNIFYMHNDIRNANLGLTNLQSINVIDNYAHTYNVNSLKFDGQTNIIPEVDFINNTMDRFVANNYDVAQGANLNVSNLNLLNLPTKEVVEILFAEEGLKDNVSYSGITSLTTPLYTYDVSYQNKQDGGYFVFAGGSALGEGKGFNPTVLSSSVNSTVGALGTMNQTFTYSFQNSDNYMNIPYAERLAYKNRNRYAISPMSNGRFSPLFTHDEVGSVWVKPYATFESVNLDNGPKVSNISYGTLIGFDTGIESIGKGWDRAFTGFIGYNGASQRYRGVDSIQNGGMLGGTMTLYKNNFFNATTVSVGASVANNQTMFGNEDYAMLLSGIANKTGYNFEFKEGKFIIQPSMLLSYTFVNTFDYTNAAGVRMQNDPFHSLQISPGVKFIGNFKGGWQPYLGVNMVWNIMGETDAYANGVKLPQMSVKPYVQYGVGVQKRMKDHFMAYGQAMVQNGGRNGLALTCGIRWSIGCKSCQKHQKVEGVKEKTQITAQTTTVSETGKKIIKQMTPQQRYAMGAKPYNPSRTATTSSTIIKYSK